MLKHFPRLYQLAAARARLDVQHNGDLFVTIPFDRIQVEYETVAIGELADQSHKVGLAKVCVCLCVYLWGMLAVVVDVFEVDLFPFEVADAGIDHYAPDPALKSALKFKLANVLEHFDEGILQHVFRFHAVVGIAQAYAHHLAGIPVKQHALAFAILPDATLDQFVLFAQNECISLGNYIDTFPNRSVALVAWDRKNNP